MIYPLFQFTPLREGRHGRCITIAKRTVYFNSRPSARGDRLHRRAGRHERRYFNSRPSARGDLHRRAGRHERRYFNSRPSARGDWRCWEKEPTQEEFQFTPLREGRHRRAKPGEKAEAISIHAPPRGATRPGNQLQSGVFHFNSRPSARGDAPSCVENVPKLKYFNSRPSARGDPCWTKRNGKDFPFQFTPLREGRHKVRRNPAVRIGFQFTPLREGRLHVTRLMFQSAKFQFTPLREGRHHSLLINAQATQFQFTPLREGRLNRESEKGFGKAFQFTPLREGRPSTRRRCESGGAFQFTPLREGRRNYSNAARLQ